MTGQAARRLFRTGQRTAKQGHSNRAVSAGFGTEGRAVLYGSNLDVDPKPLQGRWGKEQ